MREKSIDLNVAVNYGFAKYGNRTRTACAVNECFVHYAIASWANPLVIVCLGILFLFYSRWVQSTFSSHCPLSSNQCRWLTSETTIVFPLRKISGMLGVEVFLFGLFFHSLVRARNSIALLSRLANIDLTLNVARQGQKLKQEPRRKNYPEASGVVNVKKSIHIFFFVENIDWHPVHQILFWLIFALGDRTSVDILTAKLVDKNDLTFMASWSF